jgi:hypothetical protein
MMTEAQYETIEVEFPPRRLVRISGPRSLVASAEAFGQNTYRENCAEMQKTYSHPQAEERITFRPATTAETILINARDFNALNAHDFKNRTKPRMLDPIWLQLGHIIRTSEGVFINPLVQRDEQGNSIIDEETLKSFLKSDKKVNGIYLLDDNTHFAFVPYESFTRDVQDSGDFARGGLARGLEYVAGEEAPILKQMSAKENYPKGVNVGGYDSVKEPVLKVACLSSSRDIGDVRLLVDGSDWSDISKGYAFGLVKEAA